MVMDWREMAGYPTVPDWDGRAFGGDIWSGGKMIEAHQIPVTGFDPIRSWVIAVCWLLASGAECVSCLLMLAPCLTYLCSIYYLFMLVRRPRLILDFALTLVFNHLVLTTYYSAALPTSLFFWAVVLAGAGCTVVFAEQLCVKREMNEGLAVPTTDILDDVEMGDSLRRD